jgi:hypothetical protein
MNKSLIFNNKFCKNISLSQKEKDDVTIKIQENDRIIKECIEKLNKTRDYFVSKRSDMIALKIIEKIKSCFYANDLLVNISKFMNENTNNISEDGDIEVTSRVFQENNKIFEEIKTNNTAMELLAPYKDFLLDPKKCNNNPTGGKPRSKRSRKNKKSKNTRRKSIRRRRH